MTMLSRILGYAFLLSAAWLHAAVPAGPSKDITVLLFRTELVQQLHVQAGSATLRLCPVCEERQGPISLDLRRQGSFLLDGTHHPLHTLYLQGSVQMETGEHHRAEAAGRWRIDVDQDRLRVHVQIPRERYVEAVLAAEAEPEEPTESLKALAIVTRSFAATTSGRHENNALCDTTHCQALRLEPVRQAVRDAVWNTSGETVWYGARQVPAYFSQHCGGFTEDAAAAWGGSSTPWLPAHTDPWCSRIPSQWHTSLLEADVRRALAAEGIPLPGAIQQLAVLGRDRSGRVQQLRLGTNRSTQTIAAGTFRFAVNRSLGWNQIRSDRYQVQRVGDRFVFQGSGFGHGVGLCQTGAAQMARAGKSAREILQMYFPGATVRIRSQDAGWTVMPVNGFTLRTTERDGTIKSDAASAFADARTRWGRPGKMVPTLTVFPNTEAFRQATGQPGWTLAVTQGSNIATQATDVLQRHGGAHALLRHEFLHSFVEAEASAGAPLWLREGLVGVLNGDLCADSSQQTGDQVNAALRVAGSLAQSQRAHHAACALTHLYLRQHGLDAAHALLQRP